MTKYNAKATDVDGIRFASKAEAERYCQLKVLEISQEITLLELQPKYPINIGGKKICTYIGDFRYFTKDGVVVEDVKGVLTPVYRLKKKLVEAMYPGVTITEIKITKRRFIA